MSNNAYQFNNVDREILHCWDRLVDGASTVFSYPNIPERKLSGAKAGYAKVAVDEIAIGLQDGTFFRLGAARKGVLVTTKAIYWNGTGNNQIGYKNFVDIDASKVTHEGCSLLVMGNQIDMYPYSEELLEALVKFIIEATSLRKSENSDAPIEDEKIDTRSAYEILGVDLTVTVSELRRAYQVCCQRYHPDKFETRPEHIRKAMEEELKKIQSAYSELGRANS